MFTKMLSRFGVLMISASLLASCSKEVNQQELEIDQSRMRGVVGGALSQKAVLGRKIYFDSRFSEPSGMQSCSSCHLPQTGFVGMGSVASTPTTRGFIAGIAEGAVSGAYGGRKPPSAAYATYSPTFKLNGDEFEGHIFLERCGSPHSIEWENINITITYRLLAGFIYVLILSIYLYACILLI